MTDTISRFLTRASLLALALSCGGAHAQSGAAPDNAVPGSTATTPPVAHEAVTTDDTTLTTIVVNGRRPGITNVRPTATVSGLDQKLTEIPRSVTTLDSALLKDVQVRSIHDLTMAAAGTYTAAYFGVAGAVQIRGTLADSYYRGFKGINNLGYYETPTESVSNIEIVRGPVSPMYGTGKLGGMVNFTPKTDIAATLKEQSTPSALVTVQSGSNSLVKVTAEGGVPFKVGDNNAAIYVYGYYNRHGSYYRDFDPNDKEVQVGYSMDLGDKWAFNLGGRYLDTKGHLASPGWNRLTQDLIDNGNYLAGTPAIRLANAGEVALTPADLQPFINSLRRSANFVTGVVQPTTAYTALDPASVHLVKLSRRDLNTSPLDFNNNKVATGYADLVRTADNGDQIKLQGFYEHLSDDMFSAAGSATHARAYVLEGRASYVAKREITDWLRTQTVVGGSYRYYSVADFQNFGRRYVIWDRNDISQTAIPDGIINFWPLSERSNQWDFRYSSHIKNAGLFLNTDIVFFDRFHLQGGVRYDHYDIDTINRGLTSFGGALNTWYNRKAGPVSYQVSANYETPFGLIPYITYAKNRSLEANKGGGVDPSLLINNSFLSPSELKEIGVKASLFGGRLFLSVDGYKQVRSQRDQLSTSISTTHGKGIEMEARAEITPRFDLLGTATFQKTWQTGGVTLLLSPEELGFAPAATYGGEWTISTTQIPSLAQGFKDTTLPARTFSLFGSYRIIDGLKLSAGGVYVSKTSSLLKTVKLDDYVTFRALGSYTFKRYTLDVAVDNLTNKRFFYLGQAISSYSEVAALPAPGRTFTVRLAAKF